jgi:serine/threonine protein kinase
LQIVRSISSNEVTVVVITLQIIGNNTEVLLSTTLRGSKGIVRVIAAVVSDNPYRTAKAIEDDTPTSLQGILLEYHPNGTLQNVLRSPKLNSPWHRWAVQITRTVDVLHQNDITHMDLKPENIVLSKDLNAILIDPSGIGGTTRKWLSPEMRHLPKPLSQDIEARKQNDIWALGEILSAIAGATCDEMERRVLRKISLLATTEVPPRIPLRDMISILFTSLRSYRVRTRSSQRYRGQSRHWSGRLGSIK